MPKPHFMHAVEQKCRCCHIIQPPSGQQDLQSHGHAIRGLAVPITYARQTDIIQRPRYTSCSDWMWHESWVTAYKQGQRCTL